MSKFGWSYPPGAASDPLAPWNQEEGPCEVCGRGMDDCICPACHVCGTHGDPACYEYHGMIRTAAQAEGRAKLDAQMAANAAADAAEYTYWMEQRNRVTEEV